MMLRRIKSDVETVLQPKIYRKIYVGMTDIQKRWYRSILSRDSDRNEELSFNEMWMILMHLQKVVNHPKLIYTSREKKRNEEYTRVKRAEAEGSEFCQVAPQFLRPDAGSSMYLAEEELRNIKGESFIKAAGKLAMLDRLLVSLRQKGSKVLLFSQYTETLDILQEYVTMQFGPLQKVFLRLDGNTPRINRELDVRSFNAPESEIFIYLISTKAGGVGINLASVDSVILYEPCWNPQIDLQAEDRAHRIGQKRQVTVYKLITRGSFEERVVSVSERKLILDHMLIAKNNNDGAQVQKRHLRRRKATPDTEVKVSMTELWKTLKHGSERIFSSVNLGSSDVLLEKNDLDTFIENVMLGHQDIDSDNHITSDDKVYNTQQSLAGNPGIDVATTIFDKVKIGSDDKIEEIDMLENVDMFSSVSCEAGTAVPAPENLHRGSCQVDDLIRDTRTRKRIRVEPKR